MCAKKVGRNDPCPCGSGLKYKHCCAKAAYDMKGSPVFKSIHIENFRCFRKLDVDSLARINLIAGKNSVGKTAALEAFFLLMGAENLELILRISQFRGIKELKGNIQAVLELLWAPLFFQLESNRKIRIRAGLSNGREHKVELALVSSASRTLNLYDQDESHALLRPNHLYNKILKQTFSGPQFGSREFEMKPVDGNLKVEPVPSTPPFPGYFLSARQPPTQEAVSDLFGRLIKSKLVEELDLVNVLKIIEPRLVQLDVIPSAGSSMIYGDIGLEQMLPISLMGDGMARVIGILLRIANASGGIVLIDEIENGLHHSVLQDFWRVIGTAARTFNTQIVATTHSYECIREAHFAFNESDDYDFLLHRLDRVNDLLDVVTYDQEALNSAVKGDFEVR